MFKSNNGIGKMVLIMLILCYILIEGTKLGMTYFSVRNAAKEAASLYIVEKTDLAVIKNAKESLKFFKYDDSDIIVKDKKLYITYKYRGVMTKIFGLRPSFTISEDLPR